MKVEFKSFRTRVAKRVVSLFVICALLPVSVLALISYLHVRNQLYTQSQQRLKEENKTVAVSIYERLLFLNSELHIAASHLQAGSKTLSGSKRDYSQDLLASRFKSITTAPLHREPSSALSPLPLPDLNMAEMKHLETGSSLLLIKSSGGKSVQMSIVLKTRSGKIESRLVVGEIETDFLWEAVDRLSHGIEIHVLSAFGEELYTSIPGKLDLIYPNIQGASDTHTGLFEWADNAQSYLSSYSSVFLKSNFYYPKLTVVSSQSKELIYAPIKSFRYTFPLTIIVTLALVFLLSLILIQKNLGPIELLREATRKIADGAYDHQVKINSDDEFETLGDAFNSMNEKIKSTQVLLARAAKMATLGQMSSGLLHEINQPLSGVYGHVQLLQLDGGLTEKNHKRLQTILVAIERMVRMMDQFRSIGATEKTKFEPVSLKESIHTIRNLFEHQIRLNNIRCSIEIQEGLPIIFGDANGIQQIISNLMINAIHALENKKDGSREILIRVQHRAQTVILDFEDNGCGMPENVQEQIFEPFFTTKSSDKGSGLGMVIIETIVHKHEATLSFESEVGIGTRFSIEFPVTE